MKYKMQHVDKNIVVMETEKGNQVKIVFKDEDNAEIEDIVLNNLLMSYAKRICEH